MIAAIIAAILGVSWLQSKDNTKQANNEDDQQSEEQQEGEQASDPRNVDEDAANNESEGQTGDEFSYTAQSGDSYTEMARKAIQSHSSDLSEARIVYAETVLARNAGSPELNIGQSVTIKKTDISAVVEKAKNLSSSQVAAWNVYVSRVNFDTSGVGK